MEKTTTLTQEQRLQLRAWWRGEARFRTANFLDQDARMDDCFFPVPCFSRDEFCNKLSLPGWRNGTALHYQDLCFTLDGNDDHWYVYRGRTFIAVVTLRSIAATGNLARLVDQLLDADEEPARELGFHGAL